MNLIKEGNLEMEQSVFDGLFSGHLLEHRLKFLDQNDADRELVVRQLPGRAHGMSESLRCTIDADGQEFFVYFIEDRSRPATVSDVRVRYIIEVPASQTV